VKKTTGDYNDEQVSAVIRPFIRNEDFSTEALKQWRTRNRENIRRLGDIDVFPHLPRPLSNK
jgi:hypothetical protein